MTVTTVRFVWATPNANALLCDIARVSNPKGQAGEVAVQPDEKLISYLIRNGHWSPFEMVSMCLEINTSRDIGRQILRHRSFSFQEFSQRYADVEVLGSPVTREPRLQDPRNRQSSFPFDDPRSGLSISDALATEEWWASAQDNTWRNAMQYYQTALSMGIAKEQARALLPEGMTPTRMYMAGTIRSWIHYTIERTKAGTQYEHQQIAQLARNLLWEVIPALKGIE